MTADRDAALFLDADMAILAADAPAFAAYDRAIRVEYAHVPDDLFAAGRRAFFTKLLARPRIYHSSYFYDCCEAKARANIARANAGRSA